MYKRKRKVISVYLDTKDSILLLSKDRAFHILFYILNQADLERNIWYADKVHKERIMTKLNISPATLDKHIKSLKERNLIISESRGRYTVNTLILST